MQSRNEDKYLGNSFHLVLITDEQGIENTFQTLRELVSDCKGNCLTLVYFIGDKNGAPLFKFELENIEKRHPSKLIVYYANKDINLIDDKSIFSSTIIEVIINSNTCSSLRFKLSGSDEFTCEIFKKLLFLGIEKEQIEEQKILKP